MSQFANSSTTTSDEDVKPLAPLQYDIPERGDIVRLTCEPVANLTDPKKHARSLEVIRARVALCDRQESRHRGRPRLAHQSPESMIAPKRFLEDSEENKKDRFPLVCRPMTVATRVDRSL
jgi:hypothetical protein